MNRLRTDFLSASSSFLTGLGSVVNVRGELYDYNTCEDPDRIALSTDWLMVGQDLQDALSKAKVDLPSATRK